MGDKMMEKEKLNIIEEMVKNGYCLFDETPEHFANRFDLPTLLQFQQAFYKYKGLLK